MVVINKLISSSRTTEIDAASIRIVGVYKKGDWSEDAHLTKVFTDLETSSAALTSAINRDKAESGLEQKDAVRDDLLKTFHYLLLGLLHHPDTTIKTAAQAVNKVFEKYGVSIAKENYASETSLIASLLEDLSAAELQSSIAQLSGCADVIASLRTAQTDFEQTRIAFEKAKAKDGMKVSATIIKGELVKIINDRLVVYLRAMLQVDEDKYGDLTRTVATIIEDNNSMVKRRRKGESENEGEMEGKSLLRIKNTDK